MPELSTINPDDVNEVVLETPTGLGHRSYWASEVSLERIRPIAVRLTALAGLVTLALVADTVVPGRLGRLLAMGGMLTIVAITAVALSGRTRTPRRLEFQRERYTEGRRLPSGRVKK